MVANDNISVKQWFYGCFLDVCNKNKWVSTMVQQLAPSIHSENIWGFNPLTCWGSPV